MRRLLIPWLPFAATTLLFALCFWPGHMSTDSLVMIDQASGDVPLNDHHTPILVWLWEQVWPLGVRPGAILVLQVAAYLAGAYLIARAAFGRIGATAVAIAVALSPPVFGFLGVISRDVWFLDFALLAFGFLVLAVRDPGRRRIWIAAALGFAFLGLAARQNAGAALVIVTVTASAIVIGERSAGWGRLRRLGAPLAAGVALAVAGIGITQLVIPVLGAQRFHPEQYVYLYDLAGLSVRDRTSHFPTDIYPSGDVAAIAQTSSPDSVIALAFGEAAPIPMPRPSDQVAEMREAWLDEVTGDPLQYLDWRAEAFARQIGLTSPGVWIYHPRVDPNARGYEIEFTALNDIATGYQELFADEALKGPVLHRAWIYLLLALIAAVVLLRAPGPPRIVGALALSALAYQVGLFFGTMSTNWRFEFPAVTISLISTAVLARWLLERRAAQGDTPTPSAAGPE